MEYLPPHAIGAIIPSLVKGRSPRIRISVIIIGVVWIGPPCEKKAKVSEHVERSLVQ
jgi:hypothetical protein